MLQSSSICLFQFKDGTIKIVTINKPKEFELNQWILVDGDIIIDFSKFGNCKITKKCVNNINYFYEILVPDDYSRQFYVEKLFKSEFVGDLYFNDNMFKLLTKIYGETTS